MKNKFERDGVTYNNDIKFRYLNLPILAKYFVTQGLSVQAGPQIAF